MTRRAAFLRAVNLGSRRVAMSRVVEVFERLGQREVRSHINTGNIAFGGTGARGELERTIERALEAEFGFEITTFVRTQAELARIVSVEPFRVASGDTYFVTFLKSPPGAATRRELEALSNDFDTLVVVGRDVHWRMHGKSTDSRLTTRAWDRLVGKHCTTSRNMNMLRAFAAKLDG